jgi:hypothetical protein
MKTIHTLTRLVALSLAIFSFTSLDAAKRTRVYAGLVEYSDSEEEKEEGDTAAGAADTDAGKNYFEKSQYVCFDHTNSFLDATSKARLATTCKSMHMYQPPFAKNISFIDKQVRDISKKIILPEGLWYDAYLTQHAKKCIALDLFHLSMQPNEHGFYAITTLSQATKLYAHSIKKRCAITNLLYEKMIQALINTYQRPCKTALDNATAAIGLMGTVAEARIYFYNIDEANELERMAARFAWFNTHPQAADLDPIVPLKMIASTSDIDTEGDEEEFEGLATVIDFSHINALPNYEIVSHLIIDCALVSYNRRRYFHIHHCKLDFNDKTKPIIIPINGLLRINNAFECTSFTGLFTPFVREIYLESTFPALTSTAGLIAPALQNFLLDESFHAPQLQSLLIQAQNFRLRLDMDEGREAVPLLIETNLNATNVEADDYANLQHIITANLAGDPIPSDSDEEEEAASDDEVVAPEAADAFGDL